uniref:Uncharacterized protein n=1 Tax=Trebouxia lynnae TaxID=1825957 RepID=A0A6B9VNS4_9CHLO|nr:hypothetical protein [Trebouxia lynnae]QHO63932.1 hypothetical protein [Trebouxia lynnae]
MSKPSDPKTNLRVGADKAMWNNQVRKPSATTRGSALVDYKSRLQLISRQKQISIGVMLGDASLQLNRMTDF